jgi:hypothetical protein
MRLPALCGEKIIIVQVFPYEPKLHTPFYHETLAALSTPEVTPEVRKLLSALKGAMTRQEIQQLLRLKDEKQFAKITCNQQLLQVLSR